MAGYNPVFGSFVNLMGKSRKKEHEKKYSKIRDYDSNGRDFWTSYRINIRNCSMNGSMNGSVNRRCPNITMYYCLKIITNDEHPLDCVMYLINEFLNWMPAGCYKEDNLCLTCLCPIYLNYCNLGEYYFTCVAFSVCSWNCLEIYQRHKITFLENYNFRKNVLKNLY